MISPYNNVELDKYLFMEHRGRINKFLLITSLAISLLFSGFLIFDRDRSHYRNLKPEYSDLKTASGFLVDTRRKKPKLGDNKDFIGADAITLIDKNLTSSYYSCMIENSFHCYSIFFENTDYKKQFKEKMPATIKYITANNGSNIIYELSIDTKKLITYENAIRLYAFKFQTSDEFDPIPKKIFLYSFIIFLAIYSQPFIFRRKLTKF